MVGDLDRAVRLLEGWLATGKEPIDGHGCGGTDPPSDEKAVHSGGEDPDRLGGVARRDARLGACTSSDQVAILRV